VAPWWPKIFRLGYPAQSLFVVFQSKGAYTFAWSARSVAKDHADGIQVNTGISEKARRGVPEIVKCTVHRKFARSLASSKSL